MVLATPVVRQSVFAFAFAHVGRDAGGVQLVAGQDEDMAVQTGRRVARLCVACHDLSPARRLDRVGPPLWGVHERQAARIAGYRYSRAYQQRDGDCLFWTAGSLEAYLGDEDRLVPGGRVRHSGLVDAGERGALIDYLATLRDMARGRVLDHPFRSTDQASGRMPVMGEDFGDRWLDRGVREAGKCAACHDLTAARRNLVGPPLWGIAGRAAGQAKGFCYSESFRQRVTERPWVWNDPELYAFLGHPAGFVPGTRMLFEGIREEERRAGLIAHLRRLR
jgi:cytochrome c